MTAPHLALVVPTIGRPASLQRLLRSLCTQRDVPVFEVVVVADGVPAAAVGVGDPRGWPFPVRVVEQPARGAAAARNAGAHEALAPVIVFVDDDVELGDTALAAHRAFHADGVERIGAGGLTPVPAARGFTGAALAGWWEVLDDGLSDPRHRFTFRDLLTGHCSMRRGTFIRLGGFDESLRCHEDFDFGYRALRQRLSIRRVPGADAKHHDESTLTKILSRKRAEGRAGVQLARQHAELVRALPLGVPLADGRMAQRVQQAALTGGAAAAVVPILCAAGLRVFEALHMRDKWRTTLERLMDFWYWRGVLEQAGSRAAVDAFRSREGVPGAPPAFDLDLSHGLEWAESQMDAEQPQALRLWWRGVPVGTVPYVPGAEPLRGVHLRPILLKVLLPGFLRAAATVGVMPATLAAQMADGGQPAQAPAGEAVGHVA